MAKIDSDYYIWSKLCNLVFHPIDIKKNTLYFFHIIGMSQKLMDVNAKVWKLQHKIWLD